MARAGAAFALKDASNWWDQINESRLWQDRIFHVLAALYGIVAVVALVQLVRIQLRVPEYGWTTQKVFHFLNFLVNGVRSLVFVLRRDVQKLNPEILQHILLDMPSLAFFTTYALLVLFWAEIYYQARAVSTDGLRPSFYTINAVVYVIQIALWLIIWWKPIGPLIIMSKLFFAGVSLVAALGFLLYGGRLFLMLQRFPVESKGRRKKLQEVGDFAFFPCPLHLEEVTSQAWDYTISSYSLTDGQEPVFRTEASFVTFIYPLNNVGMKASWGACETVLGVKLLPWDLECLVLCGWVSFAEVKTGMDL